MSSYACTTINKPTPRNGKSGSDPTTDPSSFHHHGSTPTNNPDETNTTTRCSNRPISPQLIACAGHHEQSSHEPPSVVDIDDQNRADSRNAGVSMLEGHRSERSTPKAGDQTSTAWREGSGRRTCVAAICDRRPNSDRPDGYATRTTAQRHNGTTAQPHNRTTAQPHSAYRRVLCN